jgi:hypothetical protein
MVKAKIKESFLPPILLTSGTAPILLRSSFWLRQLPLIMEVIYRALEKWWGKELICCRMNWKKQPNLTTRWYLLYPMKLKTLII